MGEAISDVAINLIAVFIVFLGRLLGFDLYARSVRLYRRTRVGIRRLTGGTTIVVYTDCDDELHTSRTLADHLETTVRADGRRVRVKVVRDGVDLGRCSFSPKAVLAVLVLLTDVTQLDTDKRDRVRLQRRLINYVHNGGCLVLGHDVIYRRSRNEHLQRLAGCALDNFSRTRERVRYVRVDEGPRATTHTTLRTRAPETFSLTDNEVIVGEWNDDVEFLYVWDRDENTPLVTRRTVGKGTVFWVNSADSSGKGAPRSLARPEPAFVALLNLLVTTKR